MKQDEVFERFVQLAQISCEEAESYRFLCEDATQELENLTLPGLPQGAERTLCAAAAALALYRWALLSAADGEESFSLNGLGVKRTAAGVQMAREFWQECRASSCMYLRDNGFMFERILS